MGEVKGDELRFDGFLLMHSEVGFDGCHCERGAGVLGAVPIHGNEQHTLWGGLHGIVGERAHRFCQGIESLADLIPIGVIIHVFADVVYFSIDVREA